MLYARLLSYLSFAAELSTFSTVMPIKGLVMGMIVEQVDRRFSQQFYGSTTQSENVAAWPTGSPVAFSRFQTVARSMRKRRPVLLMRMP